MAASACLCVCVSVCVCVYNYHKRSHPTHVAMINCFDYGHAIFGREMPEQAWPGPGPEREREARPAAAQLWHSADLLHLQQLVKRNETEHK